MTEDTNHYIQIFKHLPSSEVALKLSGKNLPLKFILEQIEGFQKSKQKLPDWHQNEKITYPPKLNWEQCSSQATGFYKATLVSGNSVCDLTGGFGVDTFYLSKSFQEIHYVEQNSELKEIVKSNFNVLGVLNCTFHNNDSIHFLKHTKLKFSCVYIDPARRDKQNKKLVKLSDCEPDVTDSLSLIFDKTEQILIKTSPMLDIEFASKEISQIAEIHVISVENECKEVLYLLKKEFKAHPTIFTVNLSKNGIVKQKFSFYQHQEKATEIVFSEPKQYLYEPNASVLKAGAFKIIGTQFNLYKISPNTHLYTSYDLKDNFPGKTFIIKDIKPYKDKSIQGKKTNIVTRNFPFTPEIVKKEMKLRDGGTDFLFACRNLENALILIDCTKIDSEQ
jgi:16S rRNA G966 N2-methylase RsmD